MNESSNDKTGWTPALFLIGFLLCVADISWRLFAPSPYRFDLLVDPEKSQIIMTCHIHGVQKMVRIDDFKGRFHGNPLAVDRFSLNVKTLSPVPPQSELSALAPFKLSCTENDGGDWQNSHTMPCVFEFPTQKMTALLRIVERGQYSTGLSRRWYWKRLRLVRFDGELNVSALESKSLMPIENLKIQLQIEGYSEKYGKFQQ